MPPSFDDRGSAERYARLAFLFDQVFRIPGTGWRFGIEPLIGLIPGIGDAAGALLGVYGLWVARCLGAPLAIQGRMLLNLAVDALGGALPVVGDLFDFAFKAHVRNRRLLERWAGAPHETRRASWVELLALLGVVLGVGAGAMALAVWTLATLARWFG